jgi:hypothetical protein
VSSRDFAVTGLLALVEVRETLLELSVHVFVDLDVLIEGSVVDRLQPLPGGLSGRDAGIVRTVVHTALLSAGKRYPTVADLGALACAAGAR